MPDISASTGPILTKLSARECPSTVKSPIFSLAKLKCYTVYSTDDELRLGVFPHCRRKQVPKTHEFSPMQQIIMTDEKSEEKMKKKMQLDVGNEPYLSQQ